MADKPGSSAVPPPPASQKAALSPLRASVRAKAGRSSANVVLGSLLVLFVLGAFAIALPMLSARKPETPEPSARTPAARIGTVTLPSDGDGCRRMALDNQTGRMTEVERVRCVGSAAATPEDAMRDRYSGGRLEAIRRSFSER